MKIATFFGGAIRDTTTPEYSDSILIGKLLARHGYTVKNGGYFGLMEAVSKGAASLDANVHGFTCKTFPSTDGNEYLTENIVCNDIFERLRLLIADSDVFIIQKGGIGTLSELFLTLDIIRKSKVKPRIFLFGDLYQSLITVVRPLLTDRDFKALVFCKDYTEFEEKFK